MQRRVALLGMPLGGFDCHAGNRTERCPGGSVRIEWQDDPHLLRTSTSRRPLSPRPSADRHPSAAHHPSGHHPGATKVTEHQPNSPHQPCTIHWAQRNALHEGTIQSTVTRSPPRQSHHPTADPPTRHHPRGRPPRGPQRHMAETVSYWSVHDAGFDLADCCEGVHCAAGCFALGGCRAGHLAYRCPLLPVSVSAARMRRCTVPGPLLMTPIVDWASAAQMTR
jgi:hypothetical protein